jgi:hypothetical protein
MGDLHAPVLVFGSYPPVPGPASAATVAAVRRVWADGYEVLVASPRPSAAHVSARLVGPLAGYRLTRLRRSTGATERLIFGLERGVPLPVSSAVCSERARARQRATVMGLMFAFRRFRHVTVILTGDLQVPPGVLAPLWRSVDEFVLASGDHEAATVVDQFRLPGSRVRVVHVPELLPAFPGVTPVGPGRLDAGVHPRRVVVVVMARKILGVHYQTVRQWLNPLLARVLRGD